MSTPITLPPPPVPDEPGETSSPWLSAIPMLGSVGSLALVATSTAAGARGWLAGGSFLVATLAYVLVQVDRQRSQRRRRQDALRGDYLRRLDEVRRRLSEPTQARGVRWGHGPTPRRLELPHVARDADPACVRAVERFVSLHRDGTGPLHLDLTSARRAALPAGEAGRSIARALLLAAVETYAAPDLAVAVVTEDRPAWEWLAWVPHCAAGIDSDALGARRLVTATCDELAALAPADRPLLVAADGAAVPDRDGWTVLAVGGDDGVRLDPQYADRLSPAQAARRARRLPAAPAGEASDDLTDLLAVDLDRWQDWPERARDDQLCVPVGVDGAGAPVRLDLKESALGGVGPHGLVVGATGSGKSELLRTLVTALVLTHPPERLSLVLVDFKGGATFAGLGGLPHVSAVITNLADDLSLVDRMHDALSGELTRRQEVLRAAGVATTHEHDGLPSLLVVVDEFSELLAARPDFGELFVTLGRLGRSLGIHLLLASQRLEEGRLRGLESHLSWRIGLRTFSAAESRTAIGVPDAHTLPSRPGVGFLRTGPDSLVRFTASYVGGPVRRTGTEILPLTTAAVPRVAAAGPPLVDVVVAAVSRAATTGAHPVWLPPLADAPRLADLPYDVIGVVDRPREQRHDPLPLDLSGADGHVAIVGGPRSGKSTLATTLVCALARAHSPDDLRVHLVDLGDALGELDALPHVASRASRRDPDLVRRVVAAAVAAIDEDGPRTVLVVDGWATFRSEYGELEQVLTDLATRGLARDVHLVVTSTRWAEVRPGLRDLLGTRLELRLGDPLDSEVDRRRAADVPPRPGRGLTATGHHFLAALPEVRAVADRWPGHEPTRLRALPARVCLEDLPGAGLRLGLGDDGPVVLTDHLVVVGDPGSGRTQTLRTLADQHHGQVVVVDPRRSLLGAVEPARLLHHLAVPSEIRDGIAGLAAYLGGRIPGPEVTPEQVRDRSWWSGAEVLVVVDDHDLVALSGDPLHPLLPLLPHGVDIGLRVVVARRANGAARALHEPTLRTLREVGAAGLVLSAASDEGPLLGVRPTRQPPGRGRLVTRSGTGLVQVAVTSSGVP